jgi:orotate phosphoribosyltransferase
MGSRERDKLLEIVKRTSYLESDTASFHLASGIDSKYYVDCKQALSFPDARASLAKLIFDLIRNDQIDAVGGLELGAYPIAAAVSDEIYRQTGRTVRVFVVRKDRKKHGIGTLIAGAAGKGDHVVIVDDVITSGGSAIQAIDSVREAGMTVDRVVALIDREESDGRKNIEAKGVRFDALLTLRDLANFKSDSGLDEKRSEAEPSSRSATAS